MKTLTEKKKVDGSIYYTMALDTIEQEEIKEVEEKRLGPGMRFINDEDYR